MLIPTGATIWQQAAGDTDRNYVKECIEFGVILNGPGYLGKWPECNKPLRDNGISSKKVTDLWRFAEEMKDRGGSGNSDSVVSGSLASPKPPGGGEPEEQGDEANTTESRRNV